MSRFFILSLLASLSLIAKKKTNFVFFLVDDMGMMDLGTYGSTFHETPNIDNLAKTGMKFNYGYAACPVCSPTRASIMTGRHPVRVDITDWIPGSSNNKKNKLMHPKDRDNLALKEVTIAEELKSYGYQTFFAGKWHLGNQGHWPTDQGFDINIGSSSVTGDAANTTILAGSSSADVGGSVDVTSHSSMTVKTGLSDEDASGSALISTASALSDMSGSMRVVAGKSNLNSDCKLGQI